MPARKKRRNTTARTTNATSGYRAGSRTASVAGSGGTAGRGGQFVSRSQRRYDMNRAFGISVG